MTAALAPDTRIACRGVDPDKFHPPVGRRHHLEATLLDTGQPTTTRKVTQP